jgi:hypothetical protein
MLVKLGLALAFVLAACGGGSSEQPKESTRYRLPAGFVGTGVFACDEVIRLTYCSWEKQGASEETRASFEADVEGWRKDLGSSATKGPVIEECMRNSNALSDGAAPGCK